MRISSTASVIDNVKVAAYRIPTDSPEADGTYAWKATILVVVEIAAGGQQGVGYTYANRATAEFIRETLAPVVQDHDALQIPGLWEMMIAGVRNLGHSGIAAMAISAVDIALWDLKAHLLGLPLVSLLGAVRDAVPVYGSGGFTTYPKEQLQAQLHGWVEQGIRCVKMKVGASPADDLGRVRAAREAIGPETQLYVDANGAYSRKQALAWANAFHEYGVTWFEEPVPADDLDGLRLIRDRAPAGMDIAAGEYGYDQAYFHRMLAAGAVDVLQADVTRCAGITGFLRAAVLANTYGLPLSAHTAPSVHIHPCCAISQVRPLEYFHDHVRIEQMLFDGVLTPVSGMLHPDLSRSGLGIVFKHADAERYAV